MKIPLREDEITPKQLRNIELSGGFHANIPLHLTRIDLYEHFYNDEIIAKRGGSSYIWAWGLRNIMNGVYL